MKKIITFTTRSSSLYRIQELLARYLRENDYLINDEKGDYFTKDGMLILEVIEKVEEEE